MNLIFCGGTVPGQGGDRLPPRVVAAAVQKGGAGPAKEAELLQRVGGLGIEEAGGLYSDSSDTLG